MKLHKPVCRRCVGKHCAKGGGHFNDMWDGGRVFCPARQAEANNILTERAAQGQPAAAGADHPDACLFAETDKMPPPLCKHINDHLKPANMRPTLSRRVCRSCRNTKSIVPWDAALPWVFYSMGIVPYGATSPMDGDKAWDMGLVVCLPYAEARTRQSLIINYCGVWLFDFPEAVTGNLVPAVVPPLWIFDDIPKNCPFALEHIVDTKPVMFKTWRYRLRQFLKNLNSRRKEGR